MEREPEHPAADVVASEALLDRAETELEELLGEAPAAAPAPATEVTPPPAPAAAPAEAPVTAAQRVTAERPALERITMERAALQPHPRWRRFVGTITRPRWLVAIAVAAVVLGVAAIFGSELILETGGEGGREPKAGAVAHGRRHGRRAQRHGRAGPRGEGGRRRRGQRLQARRGEHRSRSRSTRRW